MPTSYYPNKHQDDLDAVLLSLIDETDPGRFQNMIDHEINPSRDVQAAYALYIMAKSYPPDFAKPAASMLTGILSTKFPFFTHTYTYELGPGLAKKSDSTRDMQLAYTSQEINRAIHQNDINTLIRHIEAPEWDRCDLAVGTIAMKEFTSPQLVEPILDTLLIPRVGRAAIHVIKGYKDPRSIPSLIWLLRFYERYEEAAAISDEILPLIGQPAIAPIVDAILKRQAHFNRLKVDRSWRNKLPQLTTRVMAPAISMVADSLKALSTALGNITDKTAKTELMQLAKHPNEFIREGAQKALSR